MAYETGVCPECDADVQIEYPFDEGDDVECDECGTELEVISLDPLEFAVKEDDIDDEGEL